MAKCLSVIKNSKQAGFLVKDDKTIIGFINILDDGKHSFVSDTKFIFNSNLIAEVLTKSKIVLLESANLQNDTGKFLYKIVSTKNMPINLIPLLKEHKNGATIPEFIAILEPYKYYVTCLLQKKNGFKIDRKVIYNNEQTSLMFWQSIFKLLSLEDFQKHTFESLLEESDSDNDENYIEDSVTDEVITDEVITDEPITNEAITDEPITDEVITDEVITSEPITVEPITVEPITVEPIMYVSSNTDFEKNDKKKTQKNTYNKVLSPEDIKNQLNTDYSIIDFDEKKFCHEIANRTDAVKINSVLNIYASWIANQNQLISKQDLKELFNDLIKINKLRYKYGNTFSVVDIAIKPIAIEPIENESIIN